jgi:hypothetical protein
VAIGRKSHSLRFGSSFAYVIHVNRSVQALRANGLIVLERGHCTISDLERLKEAAMFDPAYQHLRGEKRVAT